VTRAWLLSLLWRLWEWLYPAPGGDAMSTVPTVTLEGPALQGVAPHLMAAAQLAALPTTVRLGRVRPKARPMALPLAAYLDIEAVAPQLPETVDYAPKAMSSLSRVYLNDRFGDCVIAGKYHTVGLWSGNDQGQAVLGTDQEVYSSYQQICGPGDNGCVITHVLDWMRSRGLPFGGALHTIDGYVACDWRNKDLVRAALYLFGNLTLGINLPDAWTRAAVWDVTGSQIVGGHDVCAVGYSPQGVQICSWGRVYTITWPAFRDQRWLEECYVLLGRDWYGDDSLSPGGVNVQALRDDLQKISGGQVPPIDPVPIPPPPGPTPPTPPAPAPARLFGLNFPRPVSKGGLVRSFRAPVDIAAGPYDVVRASVMADGGGESPAPVEASE
jgi:hypothetical protein